MTSFPCRFHSLRKLCGRCISLVLPSEQVRTSTTYDALMERRSVDPLNRSYLIGEFGRDVGLNSNVNEVSLGLLRIRGDCLRVPKKICLQARFKSITKFVLSGCCVGGCVFVRDCEAASSTPHTTIALVDKLVSTLFGQLTGSVFLSPTTTMRDPRQFQIINQPSTLYRTRQTSLFLYHQLPTLFCCLATKIFSFFCTQGQVLGRAWKRCTGEETDDRHERTIGGEIWRPIGKYFP